jgi:hypothetical protein
MSNMVSCRGCGMRVSRDAEFCWICKCPFPACNLTDETNADEEILDAIPAKPRRSKGWLVALPAGLALLWTGIIIAGACVLATHWDRVPFHGLPNVNTFITRSR